MTLRFVVACEDAGGAAALVPVVRALMARGDVPTWWLGPVAERCFTDEGLRPGVAALTQHGSRAQIEETDTLSQCDVLLTATSPWGLRIEARATLRARALGCPSLGFVDFWANYEARLSFPSPFGLDALPDRLAVIDRTMRDDLIAVGVDASRLIVTGSPAFDAMLDRRFPRTGTARRVLFLSQPIAKVFGAAGTPGFLGYTEHMVLEALAPVVADALAELVIRPHPREDVAALAASVASLPCIARIEAEGPLHAAVSTARVVVGMTTMGLVEAAIAGAPTISAQLWRRGLDPLPTNRAGLIVSVIEPSALRRQVLHALDREVAPGAATASIEWKPGATGRVVDELDALVPRT